MPVLTPFQWGLGAACAFLIGVAKTGVPGLGILVVPLMVLIVGDARLSAGWLLPILCTADIFAVIYWRRHAAASKLFALLPWVVAGIILGAFALGLHERILRPIIGCIIFLMLAAYLYRRARPAALTRSTHAGPYGITAGFATTVANAAGPVMNIYLLRKQLSKEEFVATGAWFFFLINLSKLPIYTWHGMLSRNSLTFDAVMVPAVILGAVTGRWLIDHIPERVFELIIVILTGMSTLMLFR